MWKDSTTAKTSSTLPAGLSTHSKPGSLTLQHVTVTVSQNSLSQAHRLPRCYPRPVPAAGEPRSSRNTFLHLRKHFPPHLSPFPSQNTSKHQDPPQVEVDPKSFLGSPMRSDLSPSEAQVTFYVV